MSVYDSQNGEHRLSTSDRSTYRRCRRKWNWQTHDLLTPNDPNEQGAMFFGSGFHYALEDYHGSRNFPSAIDAFQAFVKVASSGSAYADGMFDSQIALATGMLDYYTNQWLPRRSDFQTLIIDGVPQTEVEFEIKIGQCSNIDHTHGWKHGEDWHSVPIFYVGTFDRVVTDPYGRIWIQDYKTAAQIDTDKLSTDPQITAYCWAGRQLYGDRFEGVLYTQFKKSVPDYPNVNKNGSLSMNKNQSTTHSLYIHALKQTYNGVIPPEYREYLNYLESQDLPEGDRFIRQDLVRRSPNQIASEDQKLHAEISEMLTYPNLTIYPNPTWNCKSDCSFKLPCITQDDDPDSLPFIFDTDYRRKTSVRESEWKTQLPHNQTRLTLMGQLTTLR